MRVKALIFGVALLLGGCTPQFVRTGNILDPRIAVSRTFTLGPAPAGYERYQADAASAVRNALRARGFRLAPDARYRVDVGFAVGSRAVEVAQPQPLASQSVGSGPILCKRERYSLSVAIIDTGNGSILFRGGAKTIWCGDLPATILPGLAEAALRSN